ncbi:type II secretion system F family protein [Agromyces soli]|uniref:Type II secretion system F family protein n=1 Tax=Agromyces soli TaxID=659012 RepID=A0ABY4APL4_9MICO|nr:type II secretion system F family protein [Agromyces soli]UOE25048.1 type II secretion system F family protein [Agromyces soli]
MTPYAFALGVVLGVGVWLLVASTPRFGRRPLVERVAPFVADLSAEARAIVDRHASDPAMAFVAMLEPSGSLLRRIPTMLVGNRTVALRLRQAGWRRGVDRFRLEQVSVAAVSAVLTAAVLMLTSFGSATPTLVVVAPVVGGIAVWSLFELVLQAAARRRLGRIDDELPTVLEFLTLSLTAGESLLDAVRRIARSSGGELSGELARAVADAGAGAPLTEALAAMRDRLAHPPLTQSLDQVIGAVDRGAPLASVLRAQAADAREAAKRRLIESAGRKEIAMLVPLVFLILPVTVVFGLFPGYLVLQAGF